MRNAQYVLGIYSESTTVFNEAYNLYIFNMKHLCKQVFYIYSKFVFKMFYFNLVLTHLLYEPHELITLNPRHCSAYIVLLKANIK